jgi:dihydrofolate reductase
MFFLYRILGPNVLVCSSLETALQRLQEPQLAEIVETAWVIGGSSVYKVCNYCLLLHFRVISVTPRLCLNFVLDLQALFSLQAISEGMKKVA